MSRPKKKTEETAFSLEAIIAEYNKEYGAGTAILASDIPQKNVVCISTGSRDLDLGLGGGFPKNRITEIRGQYSSLKSTLCLLSIANLHATDPEAIGIYLDAERTFNAGYAESLGVDCTRLLVLTPDSGEQGVDLVKRACSFPVEILMVIDSIAALVPTVEIESDTEKQTMGLHARLIGKLMRVLTARMKKSMYDLSEPATTILAINQLRQKIGVMFGDPETTPGGVGKDFFYSIILRLKSTPSMAIKNKIKVGTVEHEQIVAQEVGFKILKNKICGTQFEEGSFVFYKRDHDGNKALTLDNWTPLFKFGVVYDLIRFNDGRYVYNGDGYGIIAAHKNKFIAELRKLDDDELNDLYLQILEKILAVEGGGEVAEVEDDPYYEDEEIEEEEKPVKRSFGKKKVKVVKAKKAIKIKKR